MKASKKEITITMLELDYSENLYLMGLLRMVSAGKTFDIQEKDAQKAEKMLKELSDI